MKPDSEDGRIAEIARLAKHHGFTSDGYFVLGGDVDYTFRIDMKNARLDNFMSCILNSLQNKWYNKGYHHAQANMCDAIGAVSLE